MPPSGAASHLDLFESPVRLISLDLRYAKPFAMRSTDSEFRPVRWLRRRLAG